MKGGRVGMNVLRGITTGEEIPAAITMNNQEKNIAAKPTQKRPLLEESFTLVSVLQCPQKGGAIRVPIKRGSVALSLSLCEVLSRIVTSL